MHFHSEQVSNPRITLSCVSADVFEFFLLPVQLEYQRLESHCFIGFCAVEKYLIKSRYLQTGHTALVPSHAPSEEQSATNTQGGIKVESGGGVQTAMWISPMGTIFKLCIL